MAVLDISAHQVEWQRETNERTIVECRVSERGSVPPIEQSISCKRKLARSGNWCESRGVKSSNPLSTIFERATPLNIISTSATLEAIEELTMRSFVARLAEIAGNDEKRFADLTAKWKKETRFSSLEGKIADHPAYREIIAMGRRAIPFILADLEKTNGRWFTALREITGENPVPRQDGGTKIKTMVAAWIAWGKAHGYRW